MGTSLSVIASPVSLAAIPGTLRSMTLWTKPISNLMLARLIGLRFLRMSRTQLHTHVACGDSYGSRSMGAHPRSNSTVATARGGIAQSG